MSSRRTNVRPCRWHAAALPQVLHSSPAAILMIDLERRQVVYANAAAIDLTGDRVRLPVDVDDWSDAAGLTDLGGRRMSETTSPLSLVAGGVPVAGEPMAVHDAARRGSTATDAAAGGRRRAGSCGSRVSVCPAWATASCPAPSPQACGPGPSSCSCSSRAPSTVTGGRLEVLRDRAVVATDMSFTITDPRRPRTPAGLGQPVLLPVHRLQPGRGGRAQLQLPAGAQHRPRGRGPDRVGRWRRAPVTETLLNYRRDGTAYWNQVSISPVFDGAGELVNFVGVQNDVTERVMVEQERRAALAEAQEARGQLRLLAEATTQMTGALDVVDACARLARSAGARARRPVRGRPARPARAEVTQRLAVAARDAADEARLRRLAAARRYRPGDGRRTGGGARRRPARCCSPSSPERRRRPASRDIPPRRRSTTSCGCGRRWWCRCGRAAGCSARSRSTPSTPTAAGTAQQDLHLAADLAGRAGLAVDNARLYEMEHAAAATLQHSLLPAVPQVAGPAGGRPLSRGRRRQPGRRRLVRRAAACPTVRSGSRSATWSATTCRRPRRWASCAGCSGPTPGTAAGPARCSTGATSSCRAWRWRRWPPPSMPGWSPPDAYGGPPAALRQRRASDPAAARARRQAGTPRRTPLADDRRGTPPGQARGARPHRGPVLCTSGSILLLYTDGFTDVAGEDADERTEQLERTLAAVPPGSDPGVRRRDGAGGSACRRGCATTSPCSSCGWTVERSAGQPWRRPVRGGRPQWADPAAPRLPVGRGHSPIGAGHSSFEIPRRDSRGPHSGLTSRRATGLGGWGERRAGGCWRWSRFRRSVSPRRWSGVTPAASSFPSTVAGWSPSPSRRWSCCGRSPISPGSSKDSRTSTCWSRPTTPRPTRRRPSGCWAAPRSMSTCWTASSVRMAATTPTTSATALPGSGWRACSCTGSVCAPRWGRMPRATSSPPSVSSSASIRSPASTAWHPRPPPGDGNRAAVNRAARRIAQVYGIPLLRYRCLELTVVGEDGR